MMPPKLDNTRSHTNNFALLHTIGAVFVIVGHMYVLMGCAPPNFMGVELHTLGVELLFVVSGYLVTNSLLHRKQTAVGFYRKRLFRLYPSLIFCLLITIGLCWFITAEKSIEYWRGAWSYLWHNVLLYPVFYLPGVFTEAFVPNSVNGSLWTLPIEVACYLLLPVVLRNRKYSLHIVGLLYAVLSGVAIYLEKTGNVWHAVYWGTDWLTAIRLMAFFMSGVMAAKLKATTKKEYFKSNWALIILLLMGTWSAKIPALRYILLPYIVIAIALSSPVKSDFFNKNEYTYGLYLFAFPIQQTVIFMMQKYGCGNDIWFALILSFIFTLLCAIICNGIIENKIDKIVQNKCKKTKSRL